MTDKLYPDLTEDNNVAQENQIQIYNKNISDQVNKNLSDARIKEIQGKRNEMEKDLKHYKKILKRWKHLGNVLKISSIIIVGGSAVTSIILGFGSFTTPLILGILASIGATEGIISEGFILGIVKKKKELFKKKIDYIQEYISKSWFLFEKIREDNIISLEEVNEYRKLMQDYEKVLSVNNDQDSEYLKMREKLKHQVEKEVKKEVKEDLKKEMIQEIKQKYLSQ